MLLGFTYEDGHANVCSLRKRTKTQWLIQVKNKQKNNFVLYIA